MTKKNRAVVKAVNMPDITNLERVMKGTVETKADDGDSLSRRHSQR